MGKATAGRKRKGGAGVRRRRLVRQFCGVVVMNCKHCQYFIAREGCRLEIPEKPKAYKFLCFPLSPPPIAWRLWLIRYEQVIRHNGLLEYGICQRFPSHIERKPNDTCGEFTPIKDQ